MKFNWFFVAAASVSMVVFADAARAELITPILVTSNTSGNDFRPASNLIDGNTTTASGTWVTANPNTPAAYFPSGPTPVLTIDLGASYSLTTLELWNYAFDGNTIKTFSLQYSRDGITWSSANAYTVKSSTAFAEQDFALNAVTAKYVKMTITANFGSDRVGATEIKFVGTAVPEPLSLVLLVTGLLGLLAFAWRKRK